MLKPGEQGNLDRSGFSITHDADIEKVLAWKNGLFNFQDAGVMEVMNQLERWYDIEVVYEKEIPHIKFWGEMSRHVSLAGVLKGLKGAKLHFRLDKGRKLLILP